MSREPKPFLHRGWWKTDVGGRRHKLCPEARGLQHARVTLARLVVELAEQRLRGETPTAPPTGRPPAPPEGKTVAEVHDEFLDLKRVENDEATYAHYRDKLVPFFGRFGARPVRSLTLADGLAYKEWLLKEKVWYRGKRKLEGLGPCSVNHYVRAAKTLLNWAAKASRRYVDRSPWEEIGYLTEKPRERLMTDEEFAHLLEQCTGGNISGGARDFREQLLVLRHTTMRPGELRKLRWEYVQWDKHRIVFPPAVVKTRSRRPVTMLDAVERTLLERKARLEAGGRAGRGLRLPGPGGVGLGQADGRGR